MTRNARLEARVLVRDAAATTGRDISTDAHGRLAAPAPLATDVPAPEQAARGRIDGVDVARAIAILGMVTVHFGPREPGSGPAAFVYGSFYGKASILFVLVAGIGVALMQRRRTARPVRARLVYRFVWLLPVGLWLQSLDHPVAVILQYYALYFLFLAPFVAWSDRGLLRLAAVGLLLGSSVVLVTQILRPDWFIKLGGASPVGVAGDLLLFGYYPLATWLPPMVFGLWLGRRDLSHGRVQATLVLAGVATLVATVLLGGYLQDAFDVTPARDAWSWVLSVRGHSEMPLAIAGSTGFAAAVLGAALWLAQRWSRLLWPLTALGRLALSVYVGHLIVFHLVPGLFPAETVWEGIRTVVGFGVVTAALSVAWLAVFRRGPLEAAARWPWQHLVLPRVNGATDPG